jgi:membrane protein DedA with SNARE-associated domain
VEQPTGTERSRAAAWVLRNSNWLVLAFAMIFIVLPRVSPFEGLNEQLRVFQRLSEWMIDKIQGLFDDYGYYVVFFGVLAENTLFLGLLVPGAIIIILGGLAAENGSMNAWLLLGLAIVATILGDTASYLSGRLGWTRMLERGSMGKMLDRVRGPMQANSTWLILAYHFAGYSRVVGPTAAGLFKIPYRKWAPLDYTGGAVWVIAFASLGYLLGVFGVEFDDTKAMVRLIEIMVLVVLVGAIVIAFARTARSERPPEDGGGAATVPVPAADEQ